MTNTPPNPRTRADRSADIKSAKTTGSGVAGTDLHSSCADLIGVSTSLSRDAAFTLSPRRPGRGKSEGGRRVRCGTAAHPILPLALEGDGQPPGDRERTAEAPAREILFLDPGVSDIETLLGQVPILVPVTSVSHLRWPMSAPVGKPLLVGRTPCHPRMGRAVSAPASWSAALAPARKSASRCLGSCF